MDPLILLKATLLGLVEGLTEFLPISSTGHLIIVEDLLGINEQDRWKAFAVFIQLGAILSVCWEFRARLWSAVRHLRDGRDGWHFFINLGVAFLPAAAMGYLLRNVIKDYLFGTVTVAIALIVGGVIILWVERRQRVPRVNTVEAMTWRDALLVGIAQVVALFPGASRSGATIIGGLLTGLSRQAATEFSFFLAIPTMFAATLYDLYKSRDALSAGDIGPFAVGFAVAFVSGLLAVRGLIRYVARHDFKAFAWYRFALGAAVLVYAAVKGGP